jgi:hypothetical protein
MAIAHWYDCYARSGVGPRIGIGVCSILSVVDWATHVGEGELSMESIMKTSLPEWRKIKKTIFIFANQ